MSLRLTRYFAAVLLLAALSACGGSRPGTPTPQPTPTVRPNITITSITVSTEAQPAGYAYRAVLHLRESAGVPATISSVELTFMAASTRLVSARNERPISDGSNVCPPNSTIDTKGLTTVDADASHSFATTVEATVTYSDGASYTATASGSADVGAPNRPEPAQTFTLTGVITDASTRVGIEGARVEVMAGLNASKSASTDRTGAYVLRDLVADSFRLRVSANGYDAGEQSVTVPANPRADFELRRSGTGACSYSISPGRADVAFPGGTLTLAITRTAGSCDWRATTDAGWMTLGATSGGGSSTLTITYRPNGSFISRTGVVAIEWTGASAQLLVVQGPESPAFCRGVALTVGGQSTINNVPRAGQSYTASIVPEPGTPPGTCGMWTASASPGITISPPSSGPTPGSVTFSVSANTTWASRSLSVTVAISGGPSPTLTINQSGT